MVAGKNRMFRTPSGRLITIKHAQMAGVSTNPSELSKEDMEKLLNAAGEDMGYKINPDTLKVDGTRNKGSAPPKRGEMTKEELDKILAELQKEPPRKPFSPKKAKAPTPSPAKSTKPSVSKIDEVPAVAKAKEQFASLVDPYLFNVQYGGDVTTAYLGEMARLREMKAVFSGSRARGDKAMVYDINTQMTRLRTTESWYRDAVRREEEKQG